MDNPLDLNALRWLTGAGEDGARSNDRPAPSLPPVDDTDLLDAYSRAVVSVVDAASPAVISVFGPHEEVTYRETVSPWFRSLFIFQPDIESMAEASFAFQLHTLIGMLLFMIVPFTRLVHAFTAPFHYLFRPYIVYRSKTDVRPTGARVRRGWAPVGTTDRTRERAGRRRG